MSTGQRIRDTRESKGIFQADLAKMANINKSVMSRIENGDRAVRDDELREIAKCLNVSADYLIGRSSEPMLTSADQRDIARNVEEMKQSLENGSLRMSLDGEEITDEVKEFILDQIENTITLAKIKAKDKFTPKKYK
ncbi:helix-turn-helix transcriptional regulator [Aedoeadaptatus coxii]|uniref:helix-turn-helix domain-containing protein n=1 Tax=Aedoeadaptatus coxii TaxID=755172 RepID=UPI002AD574BD|nr:helix-turn-helix transcriptional regulator [Peptoniphilus coxii]